MARTSRRKPKTEEPQASAGHNGYDPELVKSIWDRDAEIDERVASAKGVYMRVAQAAAEERKDLYTEAKARGVNLKAYKTERKATTKERQAAALRDALEPEDASAAEMIRDALGTFAELPLGAAAVSSAEKRAADARLADSLAGD